MAAFTQDGSVQLRHNNSTKFETSSTGVTITGDANWNDNGKGEFGNAADLQFITMVVIVSLMPQELELEICLLNLLMTYI